MYNHYDTLGVNKEATPTDIKKAFRKLANEHHPDKGGDAEKFKKYNEAYSVLSDERKRSEYDARTFGGFSGNGMGFDINDFFKSHFKQTGPRSAASRQGADIQVNLNISLYDMLSGCKKAVEVQYTDRCPACQGTGALEKEDCIRCDGTGRHTQHFQTNMGTQIRTGPCQACKGTGFTILEKCPACEYGRVVKNKSVDVTVPAGVGMEATLRLAGQGMSGFYGGPNGSLFVHVRTKNPDISKLTPEQLLVLKEL